MIEGGFKYRKSKWGGVWGSMFMLILGHGQGRWSQPGKGGGLPPKFPTPKIALFSTKCYFLCETCPFKTMLRERTLS